ncbi:MAG: Ig-like domain-containing protein [Bdellovibrionales bacterium]|nr:Ig-like domain-containing protein [Bdellovibrionales bacterium]
MRDVLRNQNWIALLAVCALPAMGAGCSAQFNNPLDLSGFNRLRYDPTIDAAAGVVTADGTDVKAVTLRVLDPKTGEPIAGLELKIAATGSGNSITQPAATNANGETTAYLRSTRAEEKAITIEEPVGFESMETEATFVAGPADLANSTITGTGPVVADDSATSTITATIRDANFNPIEGSDVEIAVSGTGNTPVSTVGVPVLCGTTNSAGQAVCTVRSTRAEIKNLRLAQLDNAAFDKMGGSVTFVAGAPSDLNSDIEGTSPVFADNTSSSTITITLQDAFTNVVPGITPVFAATGTGNTLGSCSVSDVQGVSVCTLRSSVAELKDLSITSPIALTPAPAAQVSFIPEQPSWIGTAFEFEKWGLGGNPASGRQSGAFFQPQSVGYFASDDEIVVIEATGARLSRLSHLAADFLGWMGLINVMPLGGDPGCDAAAPGTVTPGWCVDGEARQETGAGAGLGELRQARGSYLASDGMMYVADSVNNRVLRYDVDTGTFQGWIGIVSAVPGGGATGCGTKIAGDFTGSYLGAGQGGWCIGGTAQTSAATGAGFNSPHGVFVDESAVPPLLYVADQLNHRISRYELLGTDDVNYVGSMGHQSGGFTGAFVDPAGGFLSNGFAVGGMNGPKDVAVYPPFIYVADSGNHRINKYFTSGVFAGWIGRIGGTSPFVGVGHAGCSGAGGGAPTPGWCAGGESQAGTGNGAFNDPVSVDVDVAGSALFVADAGNHRVMRYEITHDTIDPGLADATFTGWSGRVLTSPTGGAAGCAGRAVGLSTPGWCLGGTSGLGSGDGMFSKPSDLKYTPGGYLIVAETDNHRLSRLNAANGLFDGWSGMSLVGKQNWNPSLLPAASSPGITDGTFSVPRGTWVDSSLNLYVVDTGNHRIKRFNARTGQFTGWIGQVGANRPTGGAAGCTTVATGGVSFTPGWCMGGSSTTALGDGALMNPTGITGDNGTAGPQTPPPPPFLYVTDTGHHRIVKYNALTGLPVGWTGKVGSVPGQNPTGSNLPAPAPANCVAVSLNVSTDGWCTGGVSQAGSGGMGDFNNPRGIAYAADHIYVADSNNSRIYKIQAHTGFTVGWLGRVFSSTVPNNIQTGGPCNNGLVAGTFTPGWCKGGATQAGTDGALGAHGLSNPSGLAISGNFLYVADTGNHRVTRYDISAGGNVVTYGGWIGRVNGVGTCPAAVGGNFTPDWCMSGTAQLGAAGDGSMTSPAEVTATATHLFVADTGNHRVSKYAIAGGAFVGWQGRIATAAGLGGGAGCAVAADGDPTPAWCTGGTSGSGIFDGMLNAPISVHVESGGAYLYVGDSPNHRVMRFPTP